jgi:hypothetical protein
LLKFCTFIVYAAQFGINTIAYSTKAPDVSVFSLPKVGGVLEEQEVVMYGVDLAQPQGKGVLGLQLREEAKNKQHTL